MLKSFARSLTSSVATALLLALLVFTGLPALHSQPQPAARPAATAPAPALLDINTASAAQLKALPGIGDAYSAKIIAGRPYANKTQLLSKGILPKATYNAIAAKIIANQPKK